MRILINIRLSIGRYLLKREIKKLERDRGVYNLDDAHTVAVVYDATSRQEYERVRNFIKYLKEKEKKVISLGFIDSKDPNQILKTQLEFRFFTKKDLNWHFKPGGLEIINFLEEDYDILIDLSLENCFPLKYVSGLSKAKFKVGAANKDSTLYFDMVIDVGLKKTTDNFIENVKNYLNMINKSPTETSPQHA